MSLRKEGLDDGGYTRLSFVTSSQTIHPWSQEDLSPKVVEGTIHLFSLP